MKYRPAIPTVEFGTRAYHGLGVLAVYSAFITVLFLLSGWTPGGPDIELFLYVQGLMVPVLFATMYSAYREELSLLVLVGLTPVVSAFMVVGVILPLRSSLEWLVYLRAFPPVGIVTFAVSGLWTLLGYAMGTAARWIRQDTITRQEMLVSGRRLLLGTAIIIPSYLLAVWIWLYSDVVW